MAKIEGYAGICSCCFGPVREGEEFRFLSTKGRTFHKRCVELYPNSYYVKLEKRRAKRNG
jgi:hypothetical protein